MNYVMRTLKLVGMALFAAVMNVGLVACSSDEDDQTTSEKLLGTWVCTSASPSDADAYNRNRARIRFLQNGKCFTSMRDDGFFDTLYGYKAKPTEADWNSEFNEQWFLEDNKLSIVYSDLDRYVGPITIKGDEMTFTYQYQYWNADDRIMTPEDPEIFVAKFKRVSED